MTSFFIRHYKLLQNMPRNTEKKRLKHALINLTLNSWFKWLDEKLWEDRFALAFSWPLSPTFTSYTIQMLVYYLYFKRLFNCPLSFLYLRFCPVFFYKYLSLNWVWKCFNCVIKFEYGFLSRNKYSGQNSNFRFLRLGYVQI